MNQASFFIEKKALFGGYPNHNQIVELVEEGVVWFIDLTHCDERNIKVYSHLVNNWVNFPIKDRHVPENNKNFLIFLLIIQMVLESLKSGEKIYLHCRGGHGRSSLVISCFLGMVLKLPPFDSLNMVRRYHSRRPNLSPKWCYLRWPLSLKQRKFVETFFGSTNLYGGLSNAPTLRYGPSDHNPTQGVPFGPSGQMLNNGVKRHWVSFWLRSMNITKPKTKIDFLRYMVALNLYLNQNKNMLETLLHSGLKTIVGEGSSKAQGLILQELRLYLLYSEAKKIFES